MKNVRTPQGDVFFTHTVEVDFVVDEWFRGFCSLGSGFR